MRGGFLDFKSHSMLQEDDKEQENRGKIPLKPHVVRIEVLGDEKVGKTSLICTLVSRHFSEKVPSLLLNVQIPAEENNENVVISITDTLSRASDMMRVANATKRSDAILLVYDLSRPETFQRLRRWLDLIARYKEIPVVLVANKVDIALPSASDSQIRQLMGMYRFVVNYIAISSKEFPSVAQAFYHAQKAVLYPVEPLYNLRSKEMEPKFRKAIKRAFRLYNRHRDGILTREELNDYQYDCFGVRLLKSEMDTLIDFLSAALPDYVTPDNKGIHLEGFIYLFQLFIDKNRPESCWQVLRSFGYNNHLELEIPLERITVPLHEMDQIAQLSSSAIGFLNALFKQFDTNKDEKLTEIEIDEIFSICSEPKAPWNICSPTKMLLFEQTIDSNGLTLSSWFACWNYFMLTNPKKTLELLFYLGYDDKHAPAIVFSKRRSLTRGEKQIRRNIVRCYVFGSNAQKEKFHLFNALVRKKNPSPMVTQALNDQVLYEAVNAVSDRDGNEKYLVLTDTFEEEENIESLKVLENTADVFCVVINPLDTTCFELKKELELKLPSMVPRVLFAIKPDTILSNSKEWKEAIEQFEQEFKSTHRKYIVCEDEITLRRELTTIVEVAMKPKQWSKQRKKMGIYSYMSVLTLAVALTCGVILRWKKKGHH